ncbi:hypothetical protein KK083_09575 [Fulvivirgaceae bacterium PWU4]|uniref:Cytochrome c domain-containing protein n=1 Tax=Chryseosolibacter histidini TaxID=2782349 RepID=A0AAP2DN65_9BACT|nr:hypothetical protein [Chryseosolibacter histidini]MBT1697124.1 hypothetical protein [Chryseosolibacter histidini]
MKKICTAVVALLIVTLLVSFTAHFEGNIPKTWDLKAIKNFHLPPPDTAVEVNYAPEAYYYELPEHIITKVYPMYIREAERPGYLDSLRQLEPELVFDPSKLKTPEDWVKAGELVFHWPVAYTPVGGKVSAVDSALFRNSNGRITKEGVYPFSSYVVNEKGKLLVGSLSCASCHTRVTHSGEVIPGAQGNVFNNVRFVSMILSGKVPFPVFQESTFRLAYAPWAPESLANKPATVEEFAAFFKASRPGVSDRQGAAYLYPAMIPSLIGIKEIRYLDRTGLMKHESPADMMRYAAFNQGMDMLTAYNGFIPGGKNGNTQLPAPAEWSHPFGYVGKRYSDEQLYALTQYIYSLQPPKNPETYSRKLVAHGKLVFNQSGCVTCHTPPLYTNNKLTPANGFEPPEEHFNKYDIFNVSVGTDSVTALYSRRGTGYYKVPSLRGVWMQDAFFHNGNLTTLEEVFDRKRLSPGYVPSGYKPPHLKTMAVKGHPFGLDLSEADKKALITFLKTL